MKTYGMLAETTLLFVIKGRGSGRNFNIRSRVATFAESFEDDFY